MTIFINHPLCGQLKDCEILLVELQTVMFKSMYAWIAAYNTPTHFSSFSGIFVLCSFFLPNMRPFWYTCVHGLRPSAISNEIKLFIKKKSHM
jgi:hypothetical protein